MKNNIKVIVFSIVSFIIGLTFVTYAGTYNSEEISYDTSTSGAVQSNVKDALDFLYNKTKSGASSECPENMSCVEKPGVTMNVTGPGTVNKGTVYVGLNESNTFIVTPNSGYTLKSISCNNGYTLGSFKVLSNEAMSAQTITITNPGTTTGASCSIEFSTNEISVVSTQRTNGTTSPSCNNGTCSYPGDSCNSNSSGCICYQIANNIADFTYESHTGCNFKSTKCHSYFNGGVIPCSFYWNDSQNSWGYYSQGFGKGYCSGVITCAT